MNDPHPLRFGWLSPCVGNRWSDHKPIVVEQAKTILPTVDELFDSMWIADHFYGCDEKTDPFVEAWTVAERQVAISRRVGCSRSRQTWRAM
jgi:hypothetical protein